MTKTPTSHHGKTPEKSKAAAGASLSTVSTKSKSTAEKKASDKKKKPSVEAPRCIERLVSTTFPTAIIRRRMYLHRHHSNQDWSEGRSGITFAWAITPVLESILATTIIITMPLSIRREEPPNPYRRTYIVIGFLSNPVDILRQRRRRQVKTDELPP